MNNQSIFPDMQPVAIGAFRKLSNQTRKHITSERIAILLHHKNNYLTNLTYAQKCKVSDDRVIEVVQKRLQRNGIYLTKVIIKAVLQAEEKYYVSQYATDDMLDWAA